MTRIGWARGLAAALAALALLAACGGGTDKTKAQIRLVNASAYSALDMSIDDSKRFTAVTYGQTPTYVETDPDSDKMDTIITRNGSPTALVSLTPAVGKDQLYTVLAWGREGALKTLVLDDNTASPDNGKTRLRVINAAPDAGSVDVYLTGADDALADAAALNSEVAVGTLTPYTIVNSATWRLRVTAAGSKTDLRLDVGGLVLASANVTTLVITPGRGGVLVNALLLVDRGGTITRADSTQSRVRVAAAVADGGAVSAAVGGTALLNGVSAPAVGVYTLVGAGSPALAVSVNGTALTTTPPTLNAGGDYTLLVYGPATTPRVAWVEDNNKLPDTGKARLRLVHALAGLDDTIALNVDFTPLADAVPAGAASAYASLDGTTTAQVSVTSPAASSALFSVVDQTFLSGSTYTLFMVGSASVPSPVGILRRDR